MSAERAELINELQSYANHCQCIEQYQDQKLIDRAIAALQVAEVRNQAIEECAKAAEGEALVENLINLEDLSYNQGCEDCSAAIRALKGIAAMPTGSEK